MSPEQLKARASMLEKARAFFKKRCVTEVDCGAFIQRAPLDRNIDVISAWINQKTQAYLHTSPEYAMKKLLASGSGDIFFLGHVFRKEEFGPLHNPEFTMAEWYRIGFSLQEMIDETIAFLSLFFGALPVRYLGYKQAFEEYVGIQDLESDLSSFLPPEAIQWQKLEQLDYLLSLKIQPFLGINELTVLWDYPEDQASLACVVEKEGRKVAERFEIYYKGVELTNGYHELQDPNELKRRLVEENKRRTIQGLPPFTLDESFIHALEKGLPDCSGVSVGFDRAFMLQQNASSIHEVLIQ